ncbi:Tripartite motif-containing protein 35 [Merluccius polli]|uniref:Tripartite motif-containing protein 35 n=1 Tax=Merluccius polli TaxID=89951 RepID=A0AA47P810_MERPO|nr:Tripartite motif-containing protein 35 [Merluccius polli]
MAERGDDDRDLGERELRTQPDKPPSLAGEDSDSLTVKKVRHNTLVLKIQRLLGLLKRTPAQSVRDARPWVPWCFPCGHRLCTACVQLSRGGRGEIGHGSCTICYGSQLMDSVLHTLLEVLFQGQPRRPTGLTSHGSAGEGDGATLEAGASEMDGLEDRCLRHGQPLTMFCLEEEEPLCEECVEDEPDHHHCCSLQEAVMACKRELQSSLRPLREQLKTLTSIRDTCQDTAVHVKSQFERMSQVLREEFEKMHQFLWDREAAAMTSLREEEEEKSRRITEKMEKIRDGIEALADTLQETEEAMVLEKHVFLKNYKRASERAGYRIAEPEEELGSLLDVAKHQGCLHYHVWENMLDTIQYVPVTLDPNTASAWLSVSTDLASVCACEEQQTLPVPANRERFVHPRAVLGSKGFEAGRHSWEVEVGNNTCWSLGVARENISSRKDSWLGPEPGSEHNVASPGISELWVVSLSDGQYRAFPSRGNGPIGLRRRPRRVKVQLDWERGCLTLSDAGDNSLIYRFKQPWSGPLRPYLSTTCTKHPLRIIARKVTVITD